MPRVPYIRFWLNDFYDATAHLEHDVRNTYHAMLDAAYMTGHGSLPNDERAIRRMLGISARKWGKRRHQLMPFWDVGEDGRLHNKRLDLEWRKVTDRAFRDRWYAENAQEKPVVSTKTDKTIPEKERGPFGLPNGGLGNGNSPAISSRARAAASEAEGEISALRQRDLPAVATEVQPAAALSVGHAAQPAPNGSTKPPSNGADPMTDPATVARINAAMARLKRDLADKNLAAFERQPLEPGPAIQGATQEERDRNAALKRLEEMKAKAELLPKIGQRS
jgi:uncharacterized protein YdaU (DUF1376 family)